MDKNLIKKRMRNEEDFEIYVEQLIASRRIEDSSAVLGIARQIVDRGVDSISSSQEYTFIEYGLLVENYVEECAWGSETIPWSEMLDALDDGYCSWCRNALEKQEKE